MFFKTLAFDATIIPFFSTTQTCFNLIGLVHGHHDQLTADYRRGVCRILATEMSTFGPDDLCFVENGLEQFLQRTIPSLQRESLTPCMTTLFKKESTPECDIQAPSFPPCVYISAEDATTNRQHMAFLDSFSVEHLWILNQKMDMTWEPGQGPTTHHNEWIQLGADSLKFSLQIVRQLSLLESAPHSVAIITGLAHRGAIQHFLTHPVELYETAITFFGLHLPGVKPAPCRPDTLMAIGQWLLQENNTFRISEFLI
jgi:hypothetical protein